LPATKGIFAGTVVFGSTPVTSAGIPIPGDATSISIVLDLTAVTGTQPALTFEVQWSMDGGTWASAEPKDAFAALTTAPVTVAKKFDVKAPYFRVSITVTGTDTPTFTGTANAYL
jgi:hypothetical protein